MGKQVFTNATLVLAGTDLSDHVAEVTLDMSIADVPVTAMGAGGVQRLAGLEDSKLDVTFWQDFAASSVDKTLIAIRNGGTAVPFTLSASGTAYSDTNPKYAGSVIMTDYPPIGGKVGDGLQAKASFVVSGTITRGTS